MFLTVKIQPEAGISRQGDDLHAEVEVDFYTAVLGGEARVKTFAGEMLLKIPSKTQAGKSFRLKGKGMPVLNQAGKFGDLYLKTVIVLPQNLSEKEIAALEELNQLRRRKKA